MQTFLPYNNFAASARVLDRQRLGKQRVECLQILRALLGESKGWVNHPAVKMWKGYEYSLWSYATAVCQEWRARGYNDTCLQKIDELCTKHNVDSLSQIAPPWLGSESFHSSHRAALLAKNFKWYSQFGWKETPEINYVWPEAKN